MVLGWIGLVGGEGLMSGEIYGRAEIVDVGFETW